MSRYIVESRPSVDHEWQATSTWRHSLDSAIKCERYMQRMKGHLTRRVKVEFEA